MLLSQDMIVYTIWGRKGDIKRSNGGKSDGRMFIIQTYITYPMMVLEERKDKFKYFHLEDTENS